MYGDRINSTTSSIRYCLLSMMSHYMSYHAIINTRPWLKDMLPCQGIVIHLLRTTLTSTNCTYVEASFYKPSSKLWAGHIHTRLKRSIHGYTQLLYSLFFGVFLVFLIIKLPLLNFLQHLHIFRTQMQAIWMSGRELRGSTWTLICFFRLQCR